MKTTLTLISMGYGYGYSVIVSIWLLPYASKRMGNTKTTALLCKFRPIGVHNHAWPGTCESVQVALGTSAALSRLKVPKKGDVRRFANCVKALQSEFSADHGIYGKAQVFNADMRFTVRKVPKNENRSRR